MSPGDFVTHVPGTNHVPRTLKGCQKQTAQRPSLEDSVALRECGCDSFPTPYLLSVITISPFSGICSVTAWRRPDGHSTSTESALAASPKPK